MSSPSRWWSPRLLAALTCAITLLTACGEDDGAAGSGGGIDPSGRAFPFPTGEFTFTTLDVEDQCLDGGLNLLFMPNGKQTPWDWEFPVTLHPPEALPRTYDIPLRQPFGTMRVTVEPVNVVGERVRGAENDGVALGERQFGACVADLGADVDLDLVSTTLVTGQGALTMSNPRGDERCPVMPAACSVLLTLEAKRNQ